MENDGETAPSGSKSSRFCRAGGLVGVRIRKAGVRGELGDCSDSCECCAMSLQVLGIKSFGKEALKKK